MTCKRRLKGHLSRITCMETTNNTIVSADTGGNIMLWDLERSPETLPWSYLSGELVGTLKTVFPVAVVSLKYDDMNLAAGSADGKVKVWDLNSVRLKHTLKVTPDTEEQQQNNNAINCIALQANEIITGSQDGLIKVWDMNTGKAHTSYQNNYEISCIQQFDSNSLCFSSHQENVIKVWDSRFPARPSRIFPGFGTGVQQFSFDGAKFVAAQSNLSVAILCLGGDPPVPESIALPLTPIDASPVFFTDSLLVVAGSAKVVLRHFDAI
uniref:Uncharacterized protein n=1 Tax=Arcella intermedia TaxID=1963864 RepID=A0A6B2LAI9_9EUKA